LESDDLKVSTAIIGLGKIGLTYDFDEFGTMIPNQVMTHCRSVSTSDSFELRYMFDSNLAAVEMALEHYGGNGFQTIDAGRSQDSPELVIISVPTLFHLEAVQKVKEIWSPSTYLIEKPFGSSSSEARQLREVLALQDTKVYINYFRRYLPNFISLKSSALHPNRGNLHSVVINGYGTLENIFSHFIDILIFLESSSVLGLTKKVKQSSSPGNLSFMDTVSGVHFEFNGVGQGVRDCGMTLVYDSMVIEMTLGGRCIEIRDAQGTSIATFNADKFVFDSYQAFVLRRISEEFNLTKENTSIEDAIRIHEFIESI
jgi:predicted dehydrogenase